MALVKLSVIIPCLNSANTIGVQLDALTKQRWSEPWEVIVADNGSTDNTLSVARRYVGRIPELRIMDGSDKKGAPYAMNLAASIARGESLAFCDADDEVASDWVAVMGTVLQTYPFVASRFDFTKLNQSWIAKDMMARHPQTRGLVKLWYPPYLRFAGSCGLGIRSALHKAVGGFDESFVVVYDADYCVKIQLSGTDLFFASDALVHIRCRQKAEASFWQVYHWGEYNTLLYKRYRPHGVTEAFRWKSHARNWLDIALSIPRVRTVQGRIAWFSRLGWQLGILKGSIKNLVPPVPIP